MRRAAVLWVTMFLAGSIAGGAKADGTIILNSASDFGKNVADGTIIGVNVNPTTAQQLASNSALNSAFPIAPGQTQSKVSSIAAASSPLNGLLNSAAPGGNGQYVSSWTYGYHIDPDLTRYTINLGLVLPQVAASPTGSGINLVTIAVTSLNSSDPTTYSSRVWGFDNTILNPNPNTGLENFSLAAVDGLGTGGSNYFTQAPGFDLTKVLYVSIGYRGVFDGSYPATPDGTTGAFWTGAASLDVVAAPEPNSALVLACGLLGAGLLRRARSRHRK